MSRPDLPTNTQRIIPLDLEKPVSTSLKELLESSRNLPKRSNDIGTIHLGLDEIKRKAYNLRKYNKTKDDVNHYTKAHYLLVNSGVALEDIQNELDSIDTSRQAESESQSQSSQLQIQSQSTNPTSALDVDVYISNKKEKNILSAIEQSLSTAARDFDSFVNQNISMDWKQRKTELRESLSIILKRDVSASAATDQQEKKAKRSSNNASGTASPAALSWGKKNSLNLISSNFQFKDVKSSNESSKYNLSPDASLTLRQKFETYAEVIYQLNDNRQSGKSYQLSTVFAELSKHENNVKSKQLHEAWLILRDLTESEQEGSFASGHCSESLLQFESIQLRKKIVTKSRSYLESQYLDFINAKTSTLTNVGITDKVIKYLDTTLKKNNEWKIPNLLLINGVPIWAILFYLLRSGCYKESIELINKYKDSFQKLERSFPVYLKSYCESPEKKLSGELNARLINEFNQYFKHLNKEIDPYRYAVYKIIGRCDLTRKNLPSITLSIEDWLWVHLCLIREDDGNDNNNTTTTNNVNDYNNTLSVEPIYERYTLTDLQKTVLSYGAESFNGSNNNPMYLQVLIYTGLYENAVQYLFTLNEIDSIHLAITLSYYGLLRVIKDDNISCEYLLVNDNKGFAKVNYARLIGYYTRSFKISDPRVAVEYLLCICLLEGIDETTKQNQIKITQESICELVLETREFAMLLGKIDKDGLRIPGIIEQRKKLIYLQDDEVFLKEISERAAIKAEEEGKLYDCILLYQLSEEYDTVIALINRLLGDFLNSIDIYESIEDKITNDLLRGEINIVKLSQNFLKSFNNSTRISDKVSSFELIDTLETLLKIVDIRKDFGDNVMGNNKSYQSILDNMEALNLLPIAHNLEIDAIRGKANEFNNLNESISKNIPGLLIITMRCVNQLINELNMSVAVDSMTKDIKFENLKKISRNCIIYSGLLQHKMPAQIFTTLNNLESNM